MNTVLYRELLRNPKWQKKRLRIFERDHWACCRCHDTESQLQAHHLRYENGKAPWEYPDDAIKTLCEPCHKRVTYFSQNPGICVAWAYVSDDQETGYCVFPWTGEISTRGPDSEIDDSYECLDKSGRKFWMCGSCGSHYLRPDGVNPYDMDAWIIGRVKATAMSAWQDKLTDAEVPL